MLRRYSHETAPNHGRGDAAGAVQDDAIEKPRGERCARREHGWAPIITVGVSMVRVIHVDGGMEFPGFSGDLVNAVSVSRFELLRAHAAEMTVAAGSIVEAVDVVGNVV